MNKKVILISGGTSGLGKAIAIALQDEYNVIVFDNNADHIAQARDELTCDVFQADVTQYETLERMVSQIIEAYGGIDVLINNAGLWIQGELDENDPSYIAEVMSVNALGPILLTRAVLPHMRKHKSGHIININSQAGLYAKVKRAVYRASKWSLTGFTKSLQLDVAKDNIKVTGVYPNLMDTKLFEHANADHEMKGALEPQTVAEWVKKIIETPGNAYVSEFGMRNLGY